MMIVIYHKPITFTEKSFFFFNKEKQNNKNLGVMKFKNIKFEWYYSFFYQIRKSIYCNSAIIDTKLGTYHSIFTSWVVLVVVNQLWNASLWIFFGDIKLADIIPLYLIMPYIASPKKQN